MFDSKKKSLFKTSDFVSTAIRRNVETKQGPALKYTTSGDCFIDQFAAVGTYIKPRSFKEVSADMEILWRANPLLTLCFVLYVRMITRRTDINDTTTEEVQKGAGMRHEGIMRMLWLAMYYPDTFFKNLFVFICAGSWKDLFTMLSLDLQYHGWDGRRLRWNVIRDVLVYAMQTDTLKNLVMKYLPTIRARSKCTTIESQADTTIGKWICSSLFDGNYKAYRIFKASGNAHTWQQHISRRHFNRIQFDKIHGRALHLLVKGKFLKNQGLSQRYTEWTNSKVRKGEVIKYTGFVHELGHQLDQNRSTATINTVDQQFLGLLEKAGSIANFIPVKDTSGSMNCRVIGQNFSSYQVAKAICIMIGSMAKGEFKDFYIDFSSKSIARKYAGDSFSEKWYGENRIQSADTNFISVAQLLCDIKVRGVSEEDFPKGILCISDGGFNTGNIMGKTHIQAFRNELRKYFSREFVDNFKIVFWNIHNQFYGVRPKFETFEEDNVIYFSGFDPSVLSFLTSGRLINTYEQAMSQQIMQYLQV